MDHLHWQKLARIMPATATATCDSHYLPWRHDINRSYPICVVSPKVAKASTMVTACRCRQRYLLRLRLPCQCKYGQGCMTTDNFCVYSKNRLIQASQTGGQWYSDSLIWLIRATLAWHF